jgi:hypothetical protein
MLIFIEGQDTEKGAGSGLAGSLSSPATRYRSRHRNERDKAYRAGWRRDTTSRARAPGMGQGAVMSHVRKGVATRGIGVDWLGSVKKTERCCKSDWINDILY